MPQAHESGPVYTSVKISAESVVKLDELVVEVMREKYRVQGVKAPIQARQAHLLSMAIDIGLERVLSALKKEQKKLEYY